MKASAFLALALALGTLAAPVARADSPITPLASQIASHIAGRTVTVECPDQATFDADSGVPEGTVDGFVDSYLADDGTLHPGDVTEIAPDACAELETFASAATKPTLCVPQSETTVYASKPFRVKSRVKVRGRWKTVVKTVHRQVPVGSKLEPAGPLGPCYSSTAGAVQTGSTDPSFWDDYGNYGWAILTLAHESIHLQGDVDATVNGQVVGDPLAEAHADCYGMQWMPWVAEQLGDSADDALAIAQYVYDILYPGTAGTAYWSADCAPGGPMDVRPDKTQPWP
jgi:hypothetical protein